MSWKRPLWPATPSHSLHLHTFEYRYDSFFFFFCIHAYERRSGNACFLPVLPTGFRLFDIKKVSETPPRGITRGFFFTNFPIPLIFNANSNCFRRDFTWLCLVLSDWFRFIDYRWVYPLPLPLSSEMVYTQPWNRWRVKVNVFRKSGPNGGNFESGGHNGLFRIVWNMCYLHFSWMYFLFIRGMEN